MSITVEEAKELNRLFRESRAATRKWIMTSLDKGAASAEAQSASEADDETLIDFGAYVFSLLGGPVRE
jgi:hypothetical protein